MVFLQLAGSDPRWPNREPSGPYAELPHLIVTGLTDYPTIGQYTAGLTSVLARTIKENGGLESLAYACAVLRSQDGLYAVVEVAARPKPVSVPKQ